MGFTASNLSKYSIFLIVMLTTLSCSQQKNPKKNVLTTNPGIPNNIINSKYGELDVDQLFKDSEQSKEKLLTDEQDYHTSWFTVNGQKLELKLEPLQGAKVRLTWVNHRESAQHFMGLDFPPDQFVHFIILDSFSQLVTNNIPQISWGNDAYSSFSLRKGESESVRLDLKKIVDMSELSGGYQLKTGKYKMYAVYSMGYPYKSYTSNKNLWIGRLVSNEITLELP